MSQNPSDVVYEDFKQQGQQVYKEDGTKLQYRVYKYDTPRGVVSIEDHSAGHFYNGRPVEEGHFNVRYPPGVRPPEGVQDHYYFRSTIPQGEYYVRREVGGSIVRVPRGYRNFE